jgi:hypothetical protein
VSNIQNPWKLKQIADGEGGGTYQSRFEFTLNKLHLWNLTQYERVVYMDADDIALSKLDELFFCGHFCAVYMNPCNFHTGLLVVKVSDEGKSLCLYSIMGKLSHIHCVNEFTARHQNVHTLVKDIGK